MLADGKMQRLASLGNDEMRSFAIAPNGKSLAIVTGTWKHDAVLITGLQ